MYNAIISHHILGINQDNIPVMILSCTIMEDNKHKVVQTKPITMIAPQENLAQSSMAQLFTTVLSTAGAASWEDLTGQSVRIELNENDEIIKIGHIIEDVFFNIVEDEVEDNGETEG